MAKERDFAREITDAVQQNNVAALSAIAFYLLGKVEHDDDRRQRLANKKRIERDEKKRRGHSATSHDVAGRPATSHDVADTVHPVTTTADTHTPTARELAQMDGDAKLIRSIDRATAAYGEHWADVEAFLMRRSLAAWQPWLDEMARNVGPASQFTPTDLARVCRDEQLLAKGPLGSAFALRRFLASARQERVAETTAPRSPPSSGSTRRRDTAAAASTPAPPSTPDQHIDFDR